MGGGRNSSSAGRKWRAKSGITSMDAPLVLEPFADADRVPLRSTLRAWRVTETRLMRAALEIPLCSCSQWGSRIAAASAAMQRGASRASRWRASNDTVRLQQSGIDFSCGTSNSSNRRADASPPAEAAPKRAGQTARTSRPHAAEPSPSGAAPQAHRALQRRSWSARIAVATTSVTSASGIRGCTRRSQPSRRASERPAPKLGCAAAFSSSSSRRRRARRHRLCAPRATRLISAAARVRPCVRSRSALSLRDSSSSSCFDLPARERAPPRLTTRDEPKSIVLRSRWSFLSS
eukprot:scaffold18271_cov29-Tisochrysis_lutea.AAC.5